MDEKNNKDEFGYKVGRAFGYVLVVCMTAICLATTARIIMWIL